MSGLARTNSVARRTLFRSLAERPKYSRRFSGRRARSTPSARKRSVICSIVVLQTWQSVWPMIAISRPPLTTHASASERTVLLSGPVMRLPALRSQMNDSSGNPSARGTSAFSRGSMHVSTMAGSASANSAAPRGEAATMDSKRRGIMPDNARRKNLRTGRNTRRGPRGCIPLSCQIGTSRGSPNGVVSAPATVGHSPVGAEAPRTPGKKLRWGRTAIRFAHSGRAAGESVASLAHGCLRCIFAKHFSPENFSD